MMFFLVISVLPVFAEAAFENEKKTSEQQKKEFEEILKQAEIEKEKAKKQAEIERESEDDDNENRGLFFLGGNTSGLILTGTIVAILGVVVYAGYKVFSIRKVARAKRKASVEGMQK